MSDADPAAAGVVPRSRWEGRHRLWIPDYTGAHTALIGVCAPCGSAGSITVDGVPVPGGSYLPLGGTDVCIALVPTTTGVHTVTGPDSFGVVAVGYDVGTTYAYYTNGTIGSAPPQPEPTTSPVITSIEDVPNDQGRLVRIEWDATPQDTVGSPNVVSEYVIYRRFDPGLEPGLATRPASPLADWDYVTSVPAFAEASYATNVPTLADSTVTSGLYESVFFVRAATTEPWTFYDSEPDSGYSVDNLEPIAPMSFVALHATGLGQPVVVGSCDRTGFHAASDLPGLHAGVRCKPRQPRGDHHRHGMDRSRQRRLERCSTRSRRWTSRAMRARPRARKERRARCPAGCQHARCCTEVRPIRSDPRLPFGLISPNRATCALGCSMCGVAWCGNSTRGHSPPGSHDVRWSGRRPRWPAAAERGLLL